MITFRRLSLVSQNFFQYYMFLKRKKCVSNHIINRIVNKSGCLLAGCCFSRKSDEEVLLKKDNHRILDNKIIESDLHSTSAQHVSNSQKMKRSWHAHNDITSQQADINDEYVTDTDTFNKKQKTSDIKSDSVEKQQSVTTTDVSNKESAVELHHEAELKELEKEESKANVAKPKCRPNYFVAIKISDAQIHQTLNELQHHLVEKNEHLKKSMIQLTTLHITLLVMYIGDKETHAKAIKTLENIHQEHNDDFSRNPLKLEFKGLGHFKNRVLYAKLSANDSYNRLSSLAETVKRHFEIASICTTDSRTDFTPHLTVAKIRETKFKKQKKLPMKIDPSFYKDFNDQYFGSQEVQSIQLLSMTGPKDEVGYYSGNEIYFSAFEPKAKRDHLNKLLETEEKKKVVKEMINALMKEKMK